MQPYVGVESPFRPGFGIAPTVLAGRDDLLAFVQRRLQASTPFHRAIIGPRGEGKTVLLRQIRDRVEEEHGWATVWNDCDSEQALSATVARRLIACSREIPPLWERFSHAMARRLNISVETLIKVSVTARPDEAVPADSLLVETMRELGKAVAEHGSKVVMFFDELQSLQGRQELVRLSQALDTVNEGRLPIHTLHAGLYLPASPAERGGSFIERLDATVLSHLDLSATRLAVVEPLAREGIRVNEGAADRLVAASDGYPYFVQLFGDAAWEQWYRSGAAGPLTEEHVLAGLSEARATVDRLYRGRFDRLGPAQQQLLLAAARARLADGVIEIGLVAKLLGKPVESLSNTRQALIERHQLIEPTGVRGQLRFVLPEFHSWLTQIGIDRAHELEVRSTTKSGIAHAIEPPQERIDRRPAPEIG